MLIATWNVDIIFPTNQMFMLLCGIEHCIKNSIDMGKKKKGQNLDE